MSATTVQNTPSSPAVGPSAVDLKEAKRLAEQFSKRKLNTNSPELQARLEAWVGLFLERVSFFLPDTGERIDYPRYGMLAEIMAKTPCRVFDLPELKMRVDTAFVDTTGRMYISDTFFRLLEKGQEAGTNALFFLFQHEMEHLRRMHLQRRLDFPPELSNAAEDIRINCDINQMEVSEQLIELKAQANKNKGAPPPRPTHTEIRKGIEDYYAQIDPALRDSWAMKSPAEYDKWFGMSEEAIAAELLKTWKEPQSPGDQQEISFPLLCEGVGQDLDAMSPLAAAHGDTQAAAVHIQTAVDVRAAGRAKGKLATQQLTDLYVAIDKAMTTVEMTERNIQHSIIAGQALPGGAKAKSVNTGDDVVDGLVPIERLSALKQILQMILNPSAGGPPQNGSGMTVKDLDLPRSNPQSGPPQAGQPQPGAGGKPGADPGNDPSTANITPGNGHVMDSRELADILKKAGVHDAVKALGYDDLEKISNEENAAKQNVSAAINQAAEDAHRLGSVYPGGHMVDYAIAQLNDFYRPVISFRFAMKKIIESVGNAVRFEHDEPWQQYFTSAADQGLDSEADIGYQGSHVMGGKQRPLCFVIIDTSGSVTDTMLKRFISEAIQMARETDTGENSPEVVIVFADTIARGAPVYITVDNYEEFLSKGINYGGRGGTNFTASVQNAFHMVSANDETNLDGEEVANRLRGRKIDAMIYFTDTFDSPPQQDVIEATAFDCGMKKLPTMLFLAPKECYSDSFREGVQGYAETIFFDKNALNVDFEEVDANIESRGMRAVA